jgi:hypothetical protein
MIWDRQIAATCQFRPLKMHTCLLRKVHDHKVHDHQVRLLVWLSGCLLDCLSTHLLACLPVCLLAWLSGCSPDCLAIHLAVWLLACSSDYLPACLSVHLVVGLLACLSGYLSACLPTRLINQNKAGCFNQLGSAPCFGNQSYFRRTKIESAQAKSGPVLGLIRCWFSSNYHRTGYATGP